MLVDQTMMVPEMALVGGMRCVPVVVEALGRGVVGVLLKYSVFWAPP